MKSQIQRSNNGLTLVNPTLIESKTSFFMQFLFYFLFLLLGILGAYGCFYTAFSVPLSLQVVIQYAIVFCAIITFMLLIKISRILLLIMCLTITIYE